MAGVEDFIRQQWPVLKNRVASLEDRRRLLEAELREVSDELDKARQEFEAIDNAAKTLRTNLALMFDSNVPDQERFRRLYRFGDVPIKQAVRLTLNTFRQGLDSHDLFNAINRRYFESRLERTSFSPQLSRLKQDREVEMGQMGWILTDKGRAIMGNGPILPYNDAEEEERHQADE